MCRNEVIKNVAAIRLVGLIRTYPNLLKEKQMIFIENFKKSFHKRSPKHVVPVKVYFNRIIFHPITATKPIESML